MQYGLCPLSIVSLRKEPIDSSELLSQILYGEVFKVLENRKFWSRIRLFGDNSEGWIDNKQFNFVDKEFYDSTVKEQPLLSGDLIDYANDRTNNQLFTVVIGSRLNGLERLNHSFEGSVIAEGRPKNHLIETAFLYLNSPFLWGGKTPFGIDSSGFAQMVYKLNGHQLLREASLQATQGIPLSFIEESEPGDLAFFDNSEGEIIHVGIIMEDNYIIHAFGKVRIDRLDHTGIYDPQRGIHTHKLRVIKKII